MVNHEAIVYLCSSLTYNHHTICCYGDHKVLLQTQCQKFGHTWAS
jgi:hypothetical protein